MLDRMNKLLDEWKQEAYQMRTSNYGWGIESDIRDYKLEQLEECIEDLEKLINTTERKA